MAARWQLAGFMQAGVLLLALPVTAQVKFGEFSTNLSGELAPSYSGTYGNLTGSSHSWNLGGVATLTGNYHSPNFLSFDASVYLNQSRANSNYQSISNASGVNLTTNIFSGSHFPGSFTYSKSYNSQGNYAVPGLADYVIHGNSDVLGITWSENLPDAPSVTAGFQWGGSNYSVYGTNDEGQNKFHSLNLHSSYGFHGFNMGAFYSNGGNHSTLPEVVTGQSGLQTTTTDDTYGFSVSHVFPLQGSASAGITRTTWDTSYLGTSSTGTIDIANAVAALHPLEKLTLSGTATYSDNLSGQIIQSVIAAGGTVAGLDTNASSNSLDLMAIASYAPRTNLQTSVYAERRTQLFEGTNYAGDSYGGGVTFEHRLLGGNLNSMVNVADNVDEKSGQSTLGLTTNANFSDDIHGWHTRESFGYSQNVQTLLITYMNSYYNFSGTVRRNWGAFNISLGGGGSRTALSDQPSTANSSESYSAGVGYGAWISTSGSYSKSSGQALATGSGLIAVPVPQPVLPSSLITLYGGNSYSFGISSAPVKKLLISGSYSRSTSNTATEGSASSNNNEQFNTILQYQYRKLNFVSGYARLSQGFSNSGLPTETISSYSIGVTRWFSVF